VKGEEKRVLATTNTNKNIINLTITSTNVLTLNDLEQEAQQPREQTSGYKRFNIKKNISEKNIRDLIERSIIRLMQSRR